MDSTRKQLRMLLEATTTTRKHSAYQSLPKRLAAFIGPQDVQIHSKYEQERFAYLKSKVVLNRNSALDIGSNTGYFAFEMLDTGCRHVTAYEGSDEHYKFMQLAVTALHDEQRLTVVHKYFDFTDQDAQYDIALLLNVVHHTGDDYGARDRGIEDAKLAMLAQINTMAGCTNTLVLQMGFNWKGDIHHCLFPHGTKREMIDFISRGTSNDWNVAHIGVATRSAQDIKYMDVDETNVKRDDTLGEFLNRPIFILQSRRTPRG